MRNQTFTLKKNIHVQHSQYLILRVSTTAVLLDEVCQQFRNLLLDPHPHFFLTRVGISPFRVQVRDAKFVLDGADDHLLNVQVERPLSGDLPDRGGRFSVLPRLVPLLLVVSSVAPETDL